MDTPKNTKIRISTWKDLKDHLKTFPNGEQALDRIRTAGLNGDPDYLLDLLTEIHNISPESPFYLEDFHPHFENTHLDIYQIHKTYIRNYVEPNTMTTREYAQFVAKELGWRTKNK